MSELIENTDRFVPQETPHASMKESLTSEAFSEAIKNSKQGMAGSDSQRTGSSTSDQLPKLSLDDNTNSNGKHLTNNELNDAIKDAAKSVLQGKGGVLDNLTPEQRKTAEDILNSIVKAEPAAKSPSDSSSAGSTSDTSAAKGPADTSAKQPGDAAMAKAGQDDPLNQAFEELLVQGGRVVGGLIGAMRGLASGGIPGAISGAVTGYLGGEQSGETARQLWRALPAEARQTILDAVRRVATWSPW